MNASFSDLAAYKWRTGSAELRKFRRPLSKIVGNPLKVWRSGGKALRSGGSRRRLLPNKRTKRTTKMAGALTVLRNGNNALDKGVYGRNLNNRGEKADERYAGGKSDHGRLVALWPLSHGGCDGGGRGRRVGRGDG